MGAATLPLPFPDVSPDLGELHTVNAFGCIVYRGVTYSLSGRLSAGVRVRVVDNGDKPIVRLEGGRRLRVFEMPAEGA